MECLTCKSVSGEEPICPVPAIHEGRFWLIEHAYPTKLKGWLVLPLKRHASALHELTGEEFAELGILLERCSKLLFDELDCEKEYAACFYEAQGFQHVHVHVIGRPKDLPDESKGPGIFAMLKASEQDSIPKEGIAAFCETLRQRF